MKTYIITIGLSDEMEITCETWVLMVLKYTIEAGGNKFNYKLKN